MSDEHDESKEHATPPRRGRRFLKLAKMTASVAGHYTASRLKTMFSDEEESARERDEVHARNGEIIAETLGELKGAAMKIGQMASVAEDLLPPQMTHALKSLQREAPPMAYATIAAQIERELGQVPELLFEDFDPEPFAAASIGQVHRAVLDDGRDVVVKVQYPGIDESCDADLAQLRVALLASGMVNLNRKAFNALFDEIKARIKEELDYCNEADNVRRFQALHAEDDYLLIPEVVGERSAKRVLTLSYLPGDDLEDVLRYEDDYPQEVRDTIGTNLYRMVATQLFGTHWVHADPNPANYAFLPSGQVILYDYGCVKHLGDRQVRVYRDLVHAALAEDYARIDELLFVLGARVEGSPEVPESFYKAWCDVVLREVLQDEIFDYTQATYHTEVMKLIPMSMSYVTSFQPPAEFAVVDRVNIGLYNIFRRLGPRLRWMELLHDHVALADDLGPLEL